MLYILNEGNKELNNRTFPLAKGIRKMLRKTLENYNGDKTVDGYKRLNNILDMDTVSYLEMKRLKNFFDTYNGSNKSVEYILNGGDVMKTWVNNTLGTATQAIHDFKQAKKDAGINNAFIAHHSKDRQTHNSLKPTQTKIQTKEVARKMNDGNNIKFENKERRIFKISEEQMNELKIHQYINDDDVFDQINYFINEAFSVSDDVYGFTEAVMIDGQENLEKARLKKDIMTGLDCRQCRFHEEWLGEDITIILKVIYCKASEYQNVIQQYPNIEATYSKFTQYEKQIVITFINYENKKCDLIMRKNDIQHEANHIYQQLKKGSQYTQHKNDETAFTVHKSDVLYRFAAMFLNNIDENVRTIANILYLSCNNEQDAFVNGLDADIRYNKDIMKDDTYKNTDTYKRYKELMNNIEYCKRNKSSIQDTLNIIAKNCKITITYNSLINTANQAVKRFGKKMANVIIRNKNLMQVENTTRFKIGIDKRAVYFI